MLSRNQKAQQSADTGDFLQKKKHLILRENLNHINTYTFLVQSSGASAIQIPEYVVETMPRFIGLPWDTYYV